MDMDMDMDMDMSDAGMFTPANMRVAHIYWYLIVTVIGILAARRMMDWIRILIR
jgi:hypothetical protein